MTTKDLSILIPARNEMFLARTIEDILAHTEGDTEIIAILDGAWANPPIADHPKVTLVYHHQSIGQRAATNEAARLSSAKYLMKCDAHCAFDQGFDIKMITEMHDDWTMVPTMRNLHAFDWVCPEGHRRYQSPSGPCQAHLSNGQICGKETTRDIVWIPKTNPQSNSYSFDPTPHFQYFNEFCKRPEAQGDIVETMSLQGSCFMMTREKYWELAVCDESFGSWGSQGIEVAIKTWLSGGRVMVNKKTWYAHMFRTQGGDFGFPYPLSGNQVESAKKHARDLFFTNKWPKQVHPLSWLVEKFWPVNKWTEEDLAKIKKPNPKFPVPDKKSEPTSKEKQRQKKSTPKKGIVFYTDNQLNLKIAHAVQKRLTKISLNKHIPIVSCSLKRMVFGNKNIHFPSLKRGYLAMFKQILGGLENIEAEIVFLCEHDVLYHESHFDFIPSRKKIYYYNTNVWKVLTKDGRAIRVDDCKQLSGLCAYRKLLIQHYKKRVRRVEKEGFTRAMGFEPGTHNRSERIDNFKAKSWKSEFPNIDIRHGNNLTETRTGPKQFRNKKFAKGWKIAYYVRGWGKTKDLIKKFK